MPRFLCAFIAVALLGLSAGGGLHAGDAMPAVLADADYSRFDLPEILAVAFHPRPEQPSASSPGIETRIRVAEDAVLAARLHMASPGAPNLLFFHGNGEIVADYDDIAVLFNRLGVNFIPADYRGYGLSTGRPTVSALMGDAHLVLDHIEGWLKEHGYSGRIAVMGRSLGSAPAIELAAKHPDRVRALIVESGFAYFAPLLRLFGLHPERLGIAEGDVFGSLARMRQVRQPTLVIHAKEDHLIPFADAKALFAASPDPGKVLLPIPHADHNSIFAVGLKAYLAAVRSVLARMEQEDAAR